MSEQLKPCPFCGSHSVGDAGLWRHSIKCHNCGAKTKACYSWDDAVHLWNNRSLTPAQVFADEMCLILKDIRNQLYLASKGIRDAKIDAVSINETVERIQDLELSETRLH